MLSTSQIILKNLLKDEDYVRKVKPFIKDQYFEDESEKNVFLAVQDYFDKYNGLPTKEALIIDLNNNPKLSEKQVDKAGELIVSLMGDKDVTPKDWLLEKTEKWCQDQAIYNAITESIHIIEANKTGKGKVGTGVIPEILSQALSVCFDPNVGHDYLEQEAERFAMYHEPQSRISWGIEELDKITNKGIPSKSLSVLVGGVNVGKTLCLCHFAASFLKRGYNVLYISLEISEKEVARRIDSNLLDVDIDEILELPESSYMKKVAKMKNGMTGKLIIKEYPTATASASNFRFLMDELRLKKNFKPDIVIIDYINICASSRVKVNLTGSTYSYIKMIAEELRGLSVEYNTRILSATQLTRSGYSDTDPDITDTAESFGLPATADFMLAIVSNDKLEALNQYMMKQIKNRFGNSTKYKRFNIGVDREHQRLYQLSSSNSGKIDEDGEPRRSNPGRTKEEAERLEISAKHGSEAYKSAYSSGFSRQFGPRKTKFDGLKIE
jgi:predicted ATP-dependent serine protease